MLTVAQLIKRMFLVHCWQRNGNVMRNLTIDLPSTDGLANSATEEYAKLLNIALDNLRRDLNKYVSKVVHRDVTVSGTLTAEDELVLCDGTFTVTLPMASSAPGKVYYIKNTGTGTVTITSTSTIEGLSSVTLKIKYQELTIVSDGSEWFLLRVQNTTGWNDLLFAGLTLPRTASNAPAVTTFRGNIKAIAFQNGGAQPRETWASIHVLHDYMEGTKIFPHIHWSHNNSSPSGDVKWQLEYSVSKGHSGGTFPATTTVSLIQTAAAQYTHHIIETSTADAIPVDEVEPDSVVLFRVFRDSGDPEDTFADDAFLLFFDIHYQVDTTLTNEKVRPFTKRHEGEEIGV